MRSIFIALVAVNLVVFAAQWFSLADNPPAPKIRTHYAPQGASLQLLSERSSSGISLGASESQSKVHASGQDEPAICTLIGPYAQLLHAEYLVERLQAMDVPSRVQSIEVPDGKGYWVYLSPEISEKEALRRLYEIQAKKIDSYIIPSGDLANGISFGMFNDQNLAESKLNDIRSLGYEAKVRQVERTHSETWVTLFPGDAEKIDDNAWVELLNQQPGIEKRQNFCLGVAPE